MNWTYESAGAYLAAMIDGEGTVARHAHGKRVARRVAIVNTDLWILNQIASALEFVGVEWNAQFRNRHPSRRVCVQLQITHSDNLARLASACIPFLASHKRDRLLALIADVPIPSGTSHWASKLTYEQVEQIRGRARSEKQSVLALEFGVSESTVSRLLNGRSYRNLG